MCLGLPGQASQPRHQGNPITIPGAWRGWSRKEGRPGAGVGGGRGWSVSAAEAPWGLACRQPSCPGDPFSSPPPGAGSLTLKHSCRSLWLCPSAAPPCPWRAGQLLVVRAHVTAWRPRCTCDLGPLESSPLVQLAPRVRDPAPLSSRQLRPLPPAPHKPPTPPLPGSLGPVTFLPAGPWQATPASAPSPKASETRAPA